MCFLEPSEPQTLASIAAYARTVVFLEEFFANLCIQDTPRFYSNGSLHESVSSRNFKRFMNTCLHTAAI